MVREERTREVVEKVPPVAVVERGWPMVTGNMQSVYDRATCCQSTFFSLFFPTSPRDAGMRRKAWKEVRLARHS